MVTTWDVEGGKPVGRRYSTNGKFATLREAQEFCNGRFMFMGRFRTRLEIMEYIRGRREWAHSVVVPSTEGWRFIHPEGAELFLRAS